MTTIRKSIIGAVAVALLFAPSFAQESETARLVNLVEAAARLPDFDKKLEMPENEDIPVRSLEWTRVKEADREFRAFRKQPPQMDRGSRIALYGKLLVLLLNRIEANEQMKVPIGCLDFGPPDEIARELPGLKVSGMKPATIEDPILRKKYEILYDENAMQSRFHLWDTGLRRLESDIIIFLGFAAGAEFKGKKDYEAELLASLTQSGLTEAISRKIIKRAREKAFRFQR